MRDNIGYRIYKGIIWICVLLLEVLILHSGNSVNAAAQEETTEASKTEEVSFENDREGLVSLKKSIRKELKGRKGTWSVYVKNLDTNEYMIINDKKLPSASLIKLFVMITVYDEIEADNIKETKSLNRQMKKMITASDNASTNALTKSLTKKKTFTSGRKIINRYCRQNGYTKTAFKVEMGKTSPKNITSVRDCGRALERIYRSECVNKKYSAKMLKLLKAQTRRNKIPAGVPKKVVVANKTGETSFADNDAAIVFSKGADYVIVIMSKKGKDSVNEIRKISKITYNYFN